MFFLFDMVFRAFLIKILFQVNIRFRHDMREFTERDIDYLSEKTGIDENYLNGDNYMFYIPEVKDELIYLKGKEITLGGSGCF